MAARVNPMAFNRGGKCKSVSFDNLSVQVTVTERMNDSGIWERGPFITTYTGSREEIIEQLKKDGIPTDDIESIENVFACDDDGSFHVHIKGRNNATYLVYRN